MPALARISAQHAPAGPPPTTPTRRGRSSFLPAIMTVDRASRWALGATETLERAAELPRKDLEDRLTERPAELLDTEKAAPILLLCAAPQSNYVTGARPTEHECRFAGPGSCAVQVEVRKLVRAGPRSSSAFEPRSSRIGGGDCHRHPWREVDGGLDRRPSVPGRRSEPTLRRRPPSRGSVGGASRCARSRAAATRAGKDSPGVTTTRIRSLAHRPRAVTAAPTAAARFCSSCC
eukprot:scaffold2578_cov370-Prasinococcus_capsulatus_cf.AAC.9